MKYLPLILCLFVIGCTGVQSDPINNYADLKWTAPGDDWGVGTATCYELIWTLDTTLDYTQWAYLACTSMVTPSIAGTQESIRLNNLPSDTVIYVKIRASDEVPNYAEWSNMAAKRTPDEIPPKPIVDLVAQ